MLAASWLGWSMRVCLAASLVTCCAALAAGPGFQRLSAAGIRAALIGKTVTDDAHWADRFRPDGILDSHELGESRLGAWGIEHGELCITRKAKRAVKECFEIWARDGAVEYRRDGVSVMTGMIRDDAR